MDKRALARSRNLEILPPGGSPLPASVRAAVDTAPLTTEHACYTLLTLGGNPPNLGQVLRMADLYCVLPLPDAAPAFDQLTIQLNESPITRLSWTAPGGQASYLLEVYTTEGTLLRRTPLAGTATTALDDTGGQPTCYHLSALAGERTIAHSHLLCGLPGMARVVSP